MVYTISYQNSLSSKVYDTIVSFHIHRISLLDKYPLSKWSLNQKLREKNQNKDLQIVRSYGYRKSVIKFAKFKASGKDGHVVTVFKLQ